MDDDKPSLDSKLCIPVVSYRETKSAFGDSASRGLGWLSYRAERIPEDARIHVVRDRRATPVDEVRAKFRRIKPLAKIEATQRGWTLDVLNAIRTLATPEFTTEEAYDLVPELQRLHPDNKHVREKIRQQLQVLRDTGLLTHVSRGRWRLF